MKLILTVNVCLHSVAERTARGYFSEPRDANERNLPPAEGIPSSVHYHGQQRYDPAVIEDRGAELDITSFALPEDGSQPRERDSKPARDDESDNMYNNDRNTIYNNKDGATYSQDSFAGQSRSESGDSGFMGDDMHQSLMAKIREASAHAFDGMDQHSRLEFGPSSAGPGSKEAEAAPSYKPVYEAPSRQPDPRPHPGQRPVPLQSDDEGDYRANSLDDGHHGGERHRDDGVYRDGQPYGGPESTRGEDYRHQDDYQEKVNGEGNYRAEAYDGDDYGAGGPRGESYKGDSNHKEPYRGDDYRVNNYQDGGYEGGDYRGGDYEAEEGRRDGYAAFDPYKEAAQEEEAYRAVEGETDRYGEYSRSHGGTRYPDRDEGAAYPSRYEESAMDRGYERHPDRYEGHRGDGSPQQKEELNDELIGYHGKGNNKRSGRYGNGDFRRSGYYGNRENERSRFYGNHENEHNGHRSKREVYDMDYKEEHSIERQKRDLGGPGNIVIVTEEVRSIHPVIHRHYEGIPLPAKGASPLSKGIPTPLAKILQIYAGVPQENVGTSSSRSIFREDIPSSSFVARRALPPRDVGVLGVVEEAQKTVYVRPLSPGHAHTALQKPGREQPVVGKIQAEVQPKEGVAQGLAFTPGVIHTGFMPMIPLHRISKRSPRSRSSGHEASDRFWERTRSPKANGIDPIGISATTIEDLSTQSKKTTPDVEHSEASTNLPEKSVDKLASGDRMTSGDLQGAGSRRQTVYQPNYAGYGRQQGRQSAERQQDPYQRYLPREEDNDPYFR